MGLVSVSILHFITGRNYLGQWYLDDLLEKATANVLNILETEVIG